MNNSLSPSDGSDALTGKGHDTGRAISALVLGAALWGSIWYPYRVLHEMGVGGLWAMALSEGVATLVGLVVFRRYLPSLRWSWMLLGIGFFAGLCNVAYIVGMLKGEIMRVKAAAASAASFLPAS